MKLHENSSKKKAIFMQVYCTLYILNMYGENFLGHTYINVLATPSHVRTHIHIEDVLTHTNTLGG